MKAEPRLTCSIEPPFASRRERKVFWFFVLLAVVGHLWGRADAAILNCTPAGGSQSCTDLISEPVAPGNTISKIVVLPSSQSVDSVTLTGTSSGWSHSGALVGRVYTLTATNTGGATAAFTAELSFSASAQYVVDFETGDLSQPRLVQSCQVLGTCSNPSPVIVTTPVRHGTYAAKYPCDISDPPVLGHNHRSETLLGPLVVSGEWWYGWSTYIPADWSDDDTSCTLCGSTSRYHIFSQWHHQNTCNPSNPAMQPLQFNIHDNQMIIEHYYGLRDSSPQRVLLYTDPVNDSDLKGVWVDWVVHANWTSDPASGYIQIWKNGALIADYHDHTAFPLGCGVSAKMGLTYEIDQTRYDFTDEMRMVDASGGYSTVAPP